MFNQLLGDWVDFELLSSSSVDGWSTSTKGCAGRKYEWLLENGFEIDHHNYIEIYRKDLLDVDIMVDDNFNNVSKAQGIGILFDAPWNRQYDWFPRANNWDDVIKIIEGENKYKE